MTAELYHASLTLHTALGTPLAGDTLFGQLCWAAREHAGEAELVRLLDGYTSGRPWLVVSDAFPAGFLPRPTLPQHHSPRPQAGEGAGVREATQRKAEKGKVWIPAANTHLPLAELLASAVNSEAAFGTDRQPHAAVQAHNSLNRLTGATSEGFAPYTQPQTFYADGQKMELYLVAEDERINADTLRVLLSAIGHYGFGRDASVGLGKFSVDLLQPHTFATPPAPNAWWTLAPCAPQGQGFAADQSYWRVITRFGRHGNQHMLTGKPFKAPLLLAQTGAVFTPKNMGEPRLFIGQGLGGATQPISKAEPATVAQGYAPVAPIQMEAV